MPELPEVETIRLGLQPLLEGRRLARVEVRRPDLRWPFPADFARRLTGRRVLSLGRRAKYLLAPLDGGETLLVHLGMSGRWTIEGQGQIGTYLQPVEGGSGQGAHDHVIIETDEGLRLIYTDPRRFGAMDLIGDDTLALHPLLKNLGPEPLSNAFDGPLLLARLEGKRTPLKAALLDQRVVAGLGNIYVCEALFRAGLSPLRLAMRVNAQQASRLADAIRAVLVDALAAGGSTLRDYAKADGSQGAFQMAFRVYDRAGAPCETPGCRGVVRRVVQSGRASFYCPRCQR